ncbi:NADH:flavin oxidoreductase/NADH oxidase [Corynascus novoguineensis]|uniref:NADH:flavin oxidoreductase/NADH oxidase n=1 Tax=Corynascus novoguineensis TaxID=1126955 RepID=A0AAN7CRV2_9PEZI|nr:NADH:flavin oxidoreductase/NADH oxidase [Corynascus novoguineensis]
MTVKKLTASTPAQGVPFYTPAQNPPAGTALDTGAEVPTLFTPLKLRDLTLQNRFAVSPMCTYSADDGHLTDWHLVHLGAFALRGAALTIVEATAVTPNGRISPEDSGLWQDSQIAPLKRIADFVHSQSQKIGIQLAHAGRKASTLGPWHVTRGRHELATADVGGWPDNLWAPSAIAWDKGYPTPKEMTVAEIEGVVQSFADAAKRAVQAGIDAIEIHGAHGYLISEFLSPITNQRTDSYGGSFENRVRILLDIVRAVRAVIPSGMPLFVRISATEWMEYAGGPSWDLAQSKRLAALLPDLGVDLLDVSSGGNNPLQKIEVHPYFQVDMAAEIRSELRRAGKNMAIGAVGMISTAEMARSVVQADGTLSGQQDGTVEINGEHGTKAKADLVLVARQFLREPEFVLKTAALLGVDVQGPVQYHRAPFKKERL